MRKISMSSWEKDRAMVLVEKERVSQYQPPLEIGDWLEHRGNIRLRSAAIGLPVAIELLVRHCGGD